MLKLVCTLLDLMLNQTNKIGVYIILAILISFWSNKNLCVQYEANQETYMIASLFSRRCGVIWCNSLGDSLFQILCDKFCKNCD